MCAVDVLYKKDAALVEALNVHLENSVFGPYDHISDAVNELANVKKKGQWSAKSALKADNFEKLLKTFAESKDSSLGAILQWPTLMKLKRDRDAFAHPFDEEYVLGELKAKNPDLVPIEDALQLLLGKKVT